MARTFEFVLHFVRCVTVTVSPNRIIIIIISSSSKKRFPHPVEISQVKKIKKTNSKQDGCQNYPIMAIDDCQLTGAIHEFQLGDNNILIQDNHALEEQRI